MVSIFNQGDIVEVNLDPTVGHEPNKRRPVLVASANDFNARCALTAVVPISSVDNGYPMHVRVESDAAWGFACVEQLRTIDLSARAAERVGQADRKTMSQVLTYIGAVFGI